MAVSRGQIVRGFLLAAALPLLLILICASTFERIVVEKLLTTFAMPITFLWLVLWAVVAFTWMSQHKRFAAILSIVWLGFTLVTSPLTSHFLAARLERGIEDIQVDAVPALDAIVVLGGGTTESPNGRAVVGGAGERVILGARLFHAGKTPLLVTTGENIKSLRVDQPGRPERDGADETKEIWISLSVPEEKIKMMGGRNTREEMQVLKAWRQGLPDEAQIGLITSAWHMPRAIRLAEKEGLKFIPLPADYIAGRPPANIIELLPSGGSAGKLEMILKEYLAWLVGR